jgi:hypothetical protein
LLPYSLLPGASPKLGAFVTRNGPLDHVVRLFLTPITGLAAALFRETAAFALFIGYILNVRGNRERQADVKSTKKKKLLLLLLLDGLLLRNLLGLFLGSHDQLLYRSFGLR